MGRIAGPGSSKGWPEGDNAEHHAVSQTGRVVVAESNPLLPPEEASTRLAFAIQIGEDFAGEARAIRLIGAQEYRADVVVKVGAQYLEPVMAPGAGTEAVAERRTCPTSATSTLSAVRFGPRDRGCSTSNCVNPKRSTATPFTTAPRVCGTTTSLFRLLWGKMRRQEAGEIVDPGRNDRRPTFARGHAAS